MATRAMPAIPIINTALNGKSAALSSPNAAPVFWTWVMSRKPGMTGIWS